jgi:hypothetical protein
VTYEGRLQPVTVPARATDWTSWVTATSATDPQVVSSAAIALGVPDNTITPEMMDQETRYHISLMTAVDSVLGSVSNRVRSVEDKIQSSAEATIRALMSTDNNAADIRQERTQRITATDALAEQILTVEAHVNNDVAAQITQIIQAYTAADTALASEIDTVSSALNDNVATVTVLAESVDGIKSQFTVALNENGHVVGLIDLSQENGSSSFTVEAAQFLIALTGIDGGDPVPVFSVN